jgi:DNA-directed RNA polymerase specialized sigma24 family protein
MTDAYGPLEELSAHLRVVARAAAPERLLERLAQGGLRLHGATDLVGLLEEQARERTERAMLVEALAAWAPRDELAALALLHLLGPELEAMAERVAGRGNLDAAEAQGDVLGAAWEILTRRPPPGRCERFEAIWTAVRRDTRLRRAVADPLPEGFDREAPEEPSPTERWPGLLEAAVSAGVLSCAEAMLIMRTRVEGEPLRRVAADLGRPYDAVRKERHRAEAALRVYLSSEGSS